MPFSKGGMTEKIFPLKGVFRISFEKPAASHFVLPQLPTPFAFRLFSLHAHFVLPAQCP